MTMIKKLTFIKSPLLWMVLLFIVPFLLASMLYGFRHSLTFKIRPKGILLDPPVLATSLPFLTDLELEPGKWQLIYIAPKICNAECNQQLKVLKNIHISLGKDQDRLILKKLNHSTLSKHNISSRSSFSRANSVVIIDPKGWVMMHYPNTILNQSPKGILEDLRRLLKYSHTG